MIRFLLPLILLAGCATTPPVTRIVTITPKLPPELLSCAADPAVPVTTSQAAIARYIVTLWQSGQDCRAHVAAIKAAVK